MNEKAKAKFNARSAKARKEFDKVVAKHGKGTKESAAANKKLADDWAKARQELQNELDAL